MGEKMNYNNKNYRIEEIKEYTDPRKDLVRKYYYRLDVQYEIVKQLKNRESAILIPSWETNPNIKKKSVRNLKIHSVQYFQIAIKKLNYITSQVLELFNLYNSVGVYRTGVPFTELYLGDRDCSDWNKNHHKEMVAYDFFLDIDAGSHGDIGHALKSCVMICDYLTVLDCPFSVRFSGKGFHLIIPHQYFDKQFNDFDPVSDNSIYKLYVKIAKYLSDKFSEMIDLSIYDSRRVCKVAYSLSHYVQKTYVCWSFNNLNELETFELENYNLINMIDKNIRDRGINIFNKDGDTKKLIKEVWGK